MKKSIIYIMTIFIGWSANAQSSTLADRYFDEFAYAKSASLYEEIVKAGDSSQLNLQRLADSYYNIRNTVKSEPAYRALFQKYPETDATYRFKYAQSLKANGKSDEAKKQFEQFFVGMGNSELAQAYIKGIDDEKLKGIPYPEGFVNSGVNTALSEFTGFIQNDTLYWYSTSASTGNKTYRWNNQPFLDVKASAIDVSGNINETLPNQLTAPLNTKYHEATLCITKDGKTMFFTRDNYDGKRLRKGKGKITHLKLYSAEKVDGKWDNIKELPINNENYSVGHPALSQDESLLYFVSDMPGGKGGKDIYKVNLVNHQVLEQTVMNLGGTINTVGDEMFPYVDVNGNLFFSSNGHQGYGLLDVFVSIQHGDRFGTPKNMGQPINSNRDDFGYVATNKIGFMTSNRNGGKGDDDIYSFNLEKCNIIISGTVYDKKSQKPLSNANVRLVRANGELYKEMMTDKDGNYQFDTVECVESMNVIAEKQDYRANNAQLQLKEEQIQQDLYLTPLIIGDQIVLKPIYFDFDKWNIRSDAAYELEHIVTIMKNHPSMVIAIESHTDSRGNDRYNEILSDRRAKATRDYIISRGISKDRIQSAKGYGESQLLNKCNNGVSCTEEEHQLNRRSVFRILKD